MNERKVREERLKISGREYSVGDMERGFGGKIREKDWKEELMHTS
jgi:hypothetical protein